MLSGGFLYVADRLRLFEPATFSFSFLAAGRLRLAVSDGAGAASDGGSVRYEPSAARGRVAVFVRAQSGTVYFRGRACVPLAVARLGGDVEGPTEGTGRNMSQPGSEAA